MSIVILVEDMTLCFPVLDIVQVYTVYQHEKNNLLNKLLIRQNTCMK